MSGRESKLLQLADFMFGVGFAAHGAVDDLRVGVETIFPGVVASCESGSQDFPKPITQVRRGSRFGVSFATRVFALEGRLRPGELFTELSERCVSVAVLS
jgi:hypothetical protein